MPPKKPDSPAEHVYRFRVSDDVEGGTASFVAGDAMIDLSPENPVFETADKNLAAGIRELSFLVEAAE